MENEMAFVRAQWPVKILETDIYVALNAVRQGCGLREVKIIAELLDQTLDWDLFEPEEKYLSERLQKELEICQQCLTQSQVPISDSYILKHFCQNLALSGIFYTGKASETFKIRKQLIDVKFEIAFEKSKIDTSFEVHTFSSETEQKEFRHFYDTRLYFFPETRTKTVGKYMKQDMYHTAVLFIPLGEWVPVISDLCISYSALKYLQGLENIFLSGNSEKAKQMCMSFFDLYGSHFSLENIKFGGVFLIESSNSTSLDVFLEAIEKINLVTPRLADNILISWPVCKQNRPVEINCTRTVSIGGPEQVSIYPLWLKTLKESKSTWKVIDKGKHNTENFVGIWQFLLNCQKKCFKIPEKFSEFLSKIWLSHVSELGNICISDIFKEEEDYFQKLSNEMKTIPTMDNTFMNIFRLAIRIENVEKVYGKTCLRKMNIKSNKNVQDIIKFSMEHVKNCNDDIDTQKLWHSIIKLIQSGDCIGYDLFNGVLNWFKEKSSNKWIFFSSKINSVEQLMKIMKSKTFPALRFVTEHNMCPENFNHILTNHFQSAMKDFLEACLREKRHEEYLIVLSSLISCGFDPSAQSFDLAMVIQKLNEFVQILRTTLDSYKKQHFREKQKWVFLHIASSISSLTVDKDDSKSGDKMFSNVMKDLDRTEIKLLTEDLRNLVMRGNKKLSFILKGLVQMTGLSLYHFKDMFKVRSMTNQCTIASQSNLTESSLVNDCIQKEVKHILDKLGLTVYFPARLKHEDVLAMHENQHAEPQAFTEVPWAILHQIISVNFDFREKLLHTFLQKRTPEGKNESQTKEANFRRGLIKSRFKKSSSVEDIHPSDVFLVLFECLDPFLKRFVVQKMHLCQVAIPIIYPSFEQNGLIFSLWSLRDVYIDTGSESVASKHLRTLAFIKVGDKCKTSKSKLVNQLLRAQNDEYKTFFHRHCSLGFQKRKITNGVIEITWLVPDTNAANLEKNEFPWPLTVLNLRGDASCYKNQLNILLHLSNVMVILIDSEDLVSGCYSLLLKTLHSSDISTIILSNFSDQNEEEVLETLISETKMNVNKSGIISTIEDGDNINEIELRDLLIKSIQSFFEETDMKISLEELPEKISFILHCDENDENSVRGKKMAEELFSMIETTNYSIYEKYNKNDILPLQGSSLWQKWSKMQKEYHRCSKKEKIEKNDPRREKMKILRLKQTFIANQKCGIMSKFIEIVNANINNKEITLYFLSWLRQYLDSNSRLVLPTYREKLKNAIETYETTRSSIKAIHVNDDNEKNLEILRKKISKAEADLAHASFGLEHFFREMGQLYESFQYSRDGMHCNIERCTNHVVQSLPMIVAKLLLWGQPLEIMDGDAANVPMKWISEVFGELSRLIGRSAKIFCISVLGIQSSGKSTLLNTMFGLQFAVSAGRCTRGIFVQLIPVDRKKSSLKFDYALIIDTEGLHAPELASEKRSHDNELATLVIGLGDLSIVNIKGETLADMEDILQIVVHALIRLKQANDQLVLNQSSIFVHQNVSSLDLEKLTLHGNQKIIEKLDEMTKDAAKEEHIAYIKSFKDVIEFNPISHIKYLSDLWHGDPPMAPASNKYSTGVIKIAQDLLTDLKNKDQQAFLSIENTQAHLLSLWKGILSENFVFSFRNVLEVKAYSILERKFQELTFQLDELKLDCLKNHVQPTLRQCKNCDDLTREEQFILEEFKKCVKSKTKDIADDLETFFNESDLSEYMVHWKGRKEKELQSIASLIIQDVQQKLFKERTRCWTLLDSNNKLFKNKKELHKKATDFAKSFKDCTEKPSKFDIRKEFNHAWKIWVNEIMNDSPDENTPTKIKQMKKDIKEEICDRFKHHDFLVSPDNIESSLEKWDNKVQFEKSFNVLNIDKKMDISMPFFKKIKDCVHHQETYTTQMQRVIETMFLEIGSYVKQLERDVEYDVSLLKKVLNFVTQRFDKCNEDLSSQYGFSMTIHMKYKVLLHVSKFAFWHFSKMIEAYEDKHCLKSRIEASRDEVCALFIGICTEKANEYIVANIFCVEMKPLIIEKVERELSMYIPKVINEQFEFRKYPLIKSIMRDLAEKEGFSSFFMYIESAETYATSWITNFTQLFFGEMMKGQISRYTNVTEDFVDTIIYLIIEGVESASESNHLKVVKNWVDKFCFEIRDLNLDFSNVPFQSVLELEVNDFDNLVKNIKEQFKEMKNEISEVFAKGMTNIVWEDPSPYTSIINKLWGCPESCPWCKEPCATASREDEHSHHCIQHRPRGVGGIHTLNESEIVLESCNHAIQTNGTLRCGNWCKCSIKDDSKYHPYKKYKDYIPTWDITPSSDTSVYWSWFMAKFSKDLVEVYSLQPRDIPDDWHEITKEDAIRSLSTYE